MRIEEDVQPVAAAQAWSAAQAGSGSAADREVVENFVGFTREAQAALDSGTVEVSVAELEVILRRLEGMQARLHEQAARVAEQRHAWTSVRWGRTRSARALKATFREQAADEPGGAQRYLTDFALKIEIIRSWLVLARDQVAATDQAAADEITALAARQDAGSA